VCVSTDQHIYICRSPKQRLETYCFCSVSYYYYYYSPFFPRTMNLSTADLRNYRTEFHETWWSYRYMFLVNPKVFSFMVKGISACATEYEVYDSLANNLHILARQKKLDDLLNLEIIFFIQFY
jgi:hypothetical protein